MNFRNNLQVLEAWIRILTEEEKSEDNLTDEELEAQLEPIRELEPLSYVDPPAGNGNGDTGSVGAARAASYPAKYDPEAVFPSR